MDDVGKAKPLVARTTPQLKKSVPIGTLRLEEPITG